MPKRRRRRRLEELPGESVVRRDLEEGEKVAGQSGRKDIPVPERACGWAGRQRGQSPACRLVGGH